jgi:hypothetical protein
VVRLKFEEAQIAEDHVGRQPVFVAERGDVFGDQHLGPLADGGTLLHHRPDLVPQRASAPVLGSAQRGVQLAFQRLVKVDQFFEMRPTQLSPQCVDNFLIGKSLGETDYVEGIRSGEPFSLLRRQLFRQCRNNLVAVARPLLVEHIFADALADLPVHG